MTWQLKVGHMQNYKVKQTLMIFTNNQSHITAYIKAGSADLHKPDP
jgi:hypothetical protein